MIDVQCRIDLFKQEVAPSLVARFCPIESPFALILNGNCDTICNAASILARAAILLQCRMCKDTANCAHNSL